ncbi:MAG TPA: damage-inducible protein CinA, partial [Gammaproteobacteria bacterium]|nr:damage-inducible protein CinA [Gammaproteobacteria bacterium]
LEEFGAVSEETALAMAKGALDMSSADFSVSITGVAGPDGG